MISVDKNALSPVHLANDFSSKLPRMTAKTVMENCSKRKSYVQLGFQEIRCEKSKAVTLKTLCFVSTQQSSRHIKLVL